ncbi:transposase [Nocardia fluminea]|uniref:transposase n=1 Tax=Nocardia fluminea TaxID=134984 RepID=UPI003D11299D
MHHRRVADIRRHFAHQVANRLVKTHDRLVIEDLNVAGMLGNRRLARAISDAGWADFARLLTYKQAWRSGTVATADRWYRRANAARLAAGLTLPWHWPIECFSASAGFMPTVITTRRSISRRGRRFTRTLNDPRTPEQEAGLPKSADGKALTDILRVSVKPAREKRKPTFTPHSRSEPRTPEKGGVWPDRVPGHAVILTFFTYFARQH